MAKFLNTSLFSEWIERLIDETEKELIILVPYINISDRLFQKLIDANNRGVETLIIYRENKLSDRVREKLLSLDNLNLLHHPNLHAKCYYNENYLILGSMNLYEYSEKNNREMGALFHRCSIGNSRSVWDDVDEEGVFKDAVNEIRDVINGAEMEKPANDTINNGLDIDIIKTDFEKAIENCKRYNKYFINKIFEPIDLYGNYHAYCKNYYDKIDISIDYRITIHFNLPDHIIQNAYFNFSKNYSEYMYPGFKFYWNKNSVKAHIYKDKKHEIWEDNISDEQLFVHTKNVLSKFINDIKHLLTIR